MDEFRVLLAVSGRDQRALAREVGVSEATVSRAIAGRRRLKPDVRRRIVEALVEACLAERLPA